MPRWAIIGAAVALVILVALWLFADPLRREPVPVTRDQAVPEAGPTAAPEADPLAPPVGDREPDVRAVAPDVPGQAREPGILETEPVPSGPRVEDPFEPIDPTPEPGTGEPADLDPPPARVAPPAPQ